MNDQVLIFLMSCVLGGMLGFVYDIFRISRIAIHTSRVVTFVEDVLFFVVVTIASFTFIIIENQGVFRGLLLIGEVIGAIVYFNSISVVIIKCAGFIIGAIKWVLGLFYRLFVKPFILFFAWINGKITFKASQNNTIAPSELIE